MKPKVAFFDFAGCEGCELQIANLEESVIDIARLVDIVSFREVMKEHSDDYDIAIVEGSIARPMDEERIKKIRGKANILIALGACAHLGGVQRLGNGYTSAENKNEVYNNASPEDVSDDNPFFENPRHRALDEVVKVDYVIPGCPINRIEFAKVLVASADRQKTTDSRLPSMRGMQEEGKHLPVHDRRRMHGTSRAGRVRCNMPDIRQRMRGMQRLREPRPRESPARRPH